MYLSSGQISMNPLPLIYMCEWLSRMRDSQHDWMFGESNCVHSRTPGNTNTHGLIWRPSDTKGSSVSHCTYSNSQQSQKSTYTLCLTETPSSSSSLRAAVGDGVSEYVGVGGMALWVTESTWWMRLGHLLGLSAAHLLATSLGKDCISALI